MRVGLSAARALIAWALAGTAVAQVLTDRSPLDPAPGQATLEFPDETPTITAGTVTVRPTAGLSAAYDTNVLAQHAPRFERGLSIAEAQLKAEDDMNEMTLDSQIFARARRFFDAHDLDTTEYGGELGIQAPVGSRDEVTARVLAEQRFEPHTEIETPSFLPVSLYNDWRAETTYLHVFNRLSVRTDLSAQGFDYADPTQHFRDYTSFREELRAEYELTDGAFLVATPYHGRDDFSHFSPLVASANTTGALAGIHLSVPELFDYELTAGYFRRSYRALGSTSGLSLRGTLLWQPTRLTTLRGELSRDDEPTRIPGAFGKARTDISLELDHSYSEAVNLYARTEWIRDDFEFIDRTDRTTLAEIGMALLIGRPWLLKVAYGFGTRSSPAATDSYSRHLVSVSLIGRL